MAFNLQGALNEGYTYAEIAQHLAAKRGFDYDGAIGEGYSDEEIVDHLSSAAPKEEEPSWLEGGMEIAKTIFSPAGRGEDIDPNNPDQISSPEAVVVGLDRAASQGMAALSDTANEAIDAVAGSTPPLGQFSGMSGLSVPSKPIEGYEPNEEGILDYSTEFWRQRAAEAGETLEKGRGDRNFAEGLIYDAASSFGPMVVAGVATAATRNPSVGYALFMGVGYGEGYEDAIAKGLSPAEAALDGLVAGGAEVGGEMIGGALTKVSKAAGKKFIKDLLETAAREAGSEVATEEINTVYNAFVRGEDQGSAMEILGRFGYAGLLGGLMGGGMQAAARPFQKTQEQLDQELLDAPLTAEEEARAEEYVRDSIQRKASEEKTERQAKRDAARERAREQIDEALGRERDSTEFDYEGRVGSQRLGDQPTGPATVQEAKDEYERLNAEFEAAWDEFEDNQTPENQRRADLASAARLRAQIVKERLEYIKPHIERGLTPEQAEERYQRWMAAKAEREIDSPELRLKALERILGDIPEARLQDDYGRPMDNIALDGIENIDSLPPLPEVTEEVDPNAPTQAEIELLGRQRDPRELRDPQNVPPVGQAMVDEILDVDQYSPEELAEAARQRIESRDEQVPGLKQRALEEIDQLEQDATQGSGMWKSRAIDDLKTIVRTQLDSADLQGRVADRLRVMPVEESVEVSQESGTQIEEDAPGDTPQITETGRKIAKRFQVVKDGDRGYFEVVSFEPQDTKVHIRYNTIPAKKHRGELDAGQEMAYTDAWIDITEPNVVHITGSVGTRKKVFPKRWRAEVTQRARELRDGFDLKEGQRMRGRVTAKVPFITPPTLAEHTAQLEGQYLKDKRAEVQGRKLTKEEELKAREAARKDAKETQSKALDALIASQAEVEGGLVKMPSLPAHELDRGINIETRISKGALARINNGTAQHERVFQVLPDGRMRTLEVVPQGKGKRYAVFALAEGGNKYVNPKTTSGRSIISEGVKIGEVGPVVKDATLEKIKQQGQKKSLSDGLRIIRQRKRTAGDAQVQATPTVEEQAEGKEAAARIDYQAILKKEEAQRRERAESAKREKVEDKAGVSKIPYETSVAAKQLTKEEWEKIPAKVQQELEDLAVEDAELFDAAPGDILNREGMDRIDLEELRSEEDSRITREERADEALEERYVPPREEAETASFVGPAAPKVRNLADALQRATTMFGNFPNIRQQVVDMYSINKAKVDKAIEQLQPYAETTYDERATARQGGTKDDSMELRLFVESGGRPTLRGERQLSQVRAAINAIMASSPATANKGFKLLVEEAKQYLATRPDLPLSKQENLDVEDLSELFLVAAAHQAPRSPRSKKGWTEAEVIDIYEVAELLVQEFGVSPIEAANRAQEILYGKELGTDEFGNKRREGFPDLHNRTAQIVKAMTDRRAEAEVGGTLTEAEARAKEDLAVRDNLIRQVRDQLVVSRAQGDREAAFEAALDSALAKAGFGQQTQRVMDAVNSQKAATGVVLGSLQDKIARLEAALKEKDTLRTNYNGPAPPPTPAPTRTLPDTQGWVNLEAAEEYNKKYKKPDINPQMQLDISTLRELKGPKVDPTKGKVEEASLIEEDVPVAERELRAAEARKKREAAARKKKGLKFKGKSIDEAVKLPSPIGPGYGIYTEVKDAAQLKWKRSPTKLNEEAPQAETQEQVDATARTVSLEPETGVDAAAAFDASMAINYAASVAPLLDAKDGKSKWSPIARLRQYFSKEHGSVKGTRALSDEAIGFVQLWHERAMDSWAQAKVAMPGEWNRAKDDAVTHYLQGMRIESVAAKTNYRIPEEARKHLDVLAAAIDQLSTIGVESGAFTKTNVVAAILGGRAYLSHGLGQTKNTTKQVQAMMPELARLFEEAYPSLTEEEIDHASAQRLFNTVEYRLPNLQDNLTTGTYDGAVIGKEAGKQYLVRQLKVDGLDAPVPLAIVAESGAFIELLAEKQRLQEIVRFNIKDGVTPEQEVQRLVDSMLSEEVRTGVARGRGANYGIQQARRVLRSDSELIHAAGSRLARKGSSAELREWLEENLESRRSKSIEEFLTEVEERFPEQREIVSSIRAENNLGRKLREALNEISDPSTLISKTVDSIAETISMTRFSTDMYRMLRSQNLANVGGSPPRAANWVPMMPKGTSLGDSNFVLTENKGGAVGPGVRKVHELYVPREVAQAVRDITGYGREIENFGPALEAFRTASSWTKYGKVILNALAHVRNFSSTTLIHVSRAGVVGHGVGYANKIMLGSAIDQSKLAWGDRGRAWKERKISAAGKRLEEQMLKNNLYFDGGKSGALYDLRKYGFGHRSAATEVGHKLKRGFRKSLNAADTLFRLEDEAVKGAALITYASDYIQLTGGDVGIVKKYFETGTLTAAEQATFDKAMKVAAEQVKNNYPTFSRTPEAIKALSRFPILGAFPSFNSEMIRTTFHAASDSLGLMAGRLPDGTKIAEGQKTRALVLGSMRMSALTAAISGAATLTQLMLEWGLGSDDEDRAWYQYLWAYSTDAARSARGLLPFWQRDSLTGLRDIDPETGTFTTISVSYLSPYGSINDVINSMVHQYRDAQEAGVGSPEWDSFVALVEGTIGIFGNEEPLFANITRRWNRSVSKRESRSEFKNWMNWLDRQLSDYFGEYGNAIGAITVGTIESVVPEAIPQLISASHVLAAKIAATAPEDSYLSTIAAHEVAERLWNIQDAALNLVGLKTRTQSFEDDIIPGMAMDRLMYSKANTQFKDAVADPDTDYEHFKAAAARRRVTWSTIRDRMQAVRDHLGKDEGDVLAATIEQGKTFNTSGDNDFIEFALNEYYLPTPDQYWGFINKHDDLSEEEKVASLERYTDNYVRYLEEDQYQ